GERVHAVEAGDEVRAPLQVRLEDDLGVAPGAEAVAEPGELVAQLAVVVHLAAVDEHRDRAAVPLRDHRLAAALDVDDGEPAVPEHGVRGEPHALVVGSPAGHGLGHGLHGLPLPPEIAPVVHPAGDAAHDSPGGWYFLT